MTMDIIDYELFGDDMQYVEVTLDPQEAAVAEAGAMMYMEDDIRLETVFGDGSNAQSGVMGKLLGAGKRLLAGESMFTSLFINDGTVRRKVAFAAPFAGKIIAIDLKSVGGELICQKDSFLCGARGVSLGIAFQRKLGVGFFGGDGFIMERLQGDGIVFVHAGGTLKEITLKPNETLRVDTGCLVALQPSVAYDIQFIGKIKSALFSGEGLFFASLRGPGKVWLQSLPLSRLANRIVAAAPKTGGAQKEEGSALGMLGNILQGDR
jgi:uncharacterized protein (TIGR00266 family)